MTATLATAITAAWVTETSASPDIDRLLDAMEQVESCGNRNVVGDNGRSFGPLQIQYPYWKDSRTPGVFSRVHDRAYARRVVLNYWRRYCPNALRSEDLQWLARTHNGGPRGVLRQATFAYWNKVRLAMRRQRS